MLFSDPATTRIGHSGQQDGTFSIVIYTPQKMSIAVLTNAKGWNRFMSFNKN
jgi:hypothetical protein